ncbi:hypothetical protein CPB86DRAFT_778880 [Serendipita vermifera]|nr:hypothetical protein CPB86DRAFT_778880 [Serendipita vermifera]
MDYLSRVMNYLFNDIDEGTFLHHPLIPGQYNVQEDSYHPVLDVPNVTLPNLTDPLDIEANLPTVADPIDPTVAGPGDPTAADPVAPTAALMSPVVPSTMPPVPTVPMNQSAFSSTMRRTTKVHPCQQCHKPFHRRALAEACENRHNNLRPFHCTKQCGDPNW